MQKKHILKLSPPRLPSSLTRGWFDMINPFASSSSDVMDGDGGGGDGDDASISSLDVGSVTRNLSLRAINMRDFEHAVMKLKEARAHCGNALDARHRIELD